jgi:hypothetical protein
MNWWTATPSLKAWMSVRDADLVEGFLHQQAEKRNELRVLEWGTGLSSIYFPDYVERLEKPLTWITLEYDKSFFLQHIQERVFARKADIRMLGAPNDLNIDPEVLKLKMPCRTFYVFDGVKIRPHTSKEARDANLDAYVALPARLGVQFDVAIVDGRKRRRCLDEAARLVGNTGYVLLHDCWRKHYQCAWSQYASGECIGDKLWVGANFKTDFSDVFPWHAFFRLEA